MTLDELRGDLDALTGDDKGTADARAAVVKKAVAAIAIEDAWRGMTALLRDALANNPQQLRDVAKAALLRDADDAAWRRVNAIIERGDPSAPSDATFNDAWTKRPPEPVLWHGDNTLVAAGEVALLSSAGGLGKSFLTLQLAIAGATAAEAGKPSGSDCGLSVRAGPVLLANYEDTPVRMAQRIKMRLLDPSAPPEHLHHVAPDGLGPLYAVDAAGSNRAPAPTTDWHRLWTSVERIKPSLVVVDPASSALAGASTSDDLAVRGFMRALAAEAERTGCAVLVVAHDTKAARNLSKGGDDPGAGAVAGSAAWQDSARAVLYMAKDADTGNRKLRCVKANYGRAGWEVALAEHTRKGGAFLGFKAEEAGKWS